MDKWPRLHYSLFYVIFYLNFVGFSLLFNPQWIFRLFGSTGTYEDMFPHVAGMLLSGLGLILGAILYFETQVLYPGTILVRAYFAICTLYFFKESGDPFFEVMFGIIGFGVTLSTTCFLLDLYHRRKQRSEAPATA